MLDAVHRFGPSILFNRRERFANLLEFGCYFQQHYKQIHTISVIKGGTLDIPPQSLPQLFKFHAESPFMLKGFHGSLR